MRIYKPSYTKALPEKSKTVIRKGKRFIRFKSKGHISEARLTKSGDKILVETNHWHISFEDNIGIRRELKAFTNSQASQRLADNIQRLLDSKANNIPLSDDLQKWLEQLPSKILDKLIGWKILDANRMTAGKELSGYIEEFKDYLSKKERNPKHIKEITGTLNRIFRECGFVTWSDISPDKLIGWLDDLRDEGRGISKRRYNTLLKTAKQFCRWMIRQGKAASSPIEYLDGLDNPQTDQRHPRRVLELNDFLRFLDAALAGETKFGMSGIERNFIYRFAVETGLRSIDLHRLRIQDCNFEEQKITIKAGRTKNKQDAIIYLKPATALELQQYCKNKLPHIKVFHLTDKTSKMVRFDLANAKIPYVDSDGKYFDFHSLRHQSASLFAMNPDTSEATRQKLLRHKTPEMTRHYTHAAESQQREAVEALPDLRQASKETQQNIKTGTDDKNTGKILRFPCSGDI